MSWADEWGYALVTVVSLTWAVVASVRLLDARRRPSDWTGRPARTRMARRMTLQERNEARRKAS